MSLAESQFGRASNGELCAISGDDDVVGGKSRSLSSNLDLVVKVLLEHGNIENLIIDGLSAVDDELDNFLSFDLRNGGKKIS